MKTPNIRNIRQRIFLRSQRITGIVLLQLLATCKNTAMTIAHINCLETVFLNDFCWNFLHNAFLRLTCLMNSLQILVFQLDWRGKNHAWKTNRQECVVFIGLFMLFGGVAQIIHAFNVRRWGQFFIWLLSGILYTAAGAVCFFNPYLTAPILIFVLAFALIIAGIIRMVIGFRSHYIRGSHWVIIAGILTTLLGIVILVGWPADWWILGLLLAIDLIFQGWGWIAFAFGLKTAER